MGPKQHVLVVDDENNILSSLRRALQIEGFQVTVADGGEAALEAVEKGAVDLVLLDVAMPDIDGIEVLRRIKAKAPDQPVVMMSGHSTIETAVQATKLGAFDFIEKPLASERLLLTIRNALDSGRLRRENAELRRLQLGEMVGRSEAIKQIEQTIAKAAPTSGRVLITGPNGTGKELVARSLHVNSQRAEGPFIKVNCAAIAHDLIESELFGHEKGAFTGAANRRIGKFEQAHGGTLFLDEIGDMSLAAQAKVLRVLQEGELERVGGAETIIVDVRVIAATNKDLFAEIAAGRFREDLYYRLNVVPIALPALSERREDIPELVAHFLRQTSESHGRRPKQIEQSALTLLMQQPWPGNIRELRNVVERLVILVESPTIAAEHIVELLNVPSAVPVRRAAGELPLRDVVMAAEREAILAALERHEGQVAKAAAQLGLERSHLYKKMKILGIDRS
ncbi:MAG: sigma-54-dependent Fis family transcriptional regulator [Deltaproteobacteria bacterium]|nr:sigma-54-dependent Fis family transcriptional regulator [Deltaproteobacteria bacterium]